MMQSFIFILAIINSRVALVLQYPGRDLKLKAIIKAQWRKYYDCLEEDYQSLGQSLKRKLDSRFVFPGQGVRLVCTPCRRPFEDPAALEWRYQSLGPNSTQATYSDLPTEFTLSDSQDLIVQNVRAEFTGIYQCYRGNSSLSAFFLEVPRIVEIIQVGPYSPEESPIQSFRDSFSLKVEWGEWSECSSCTRVGKRFQYGACSITEQEKLPDQSSERDENEQLQNKTARVAMQLGTILAQFQNGVSCSSKFLPDDVRTEIKMKGATHFAAIEFCKVECPTESPVQELDLEEKLKAAGGNIESVLKKLEDKVLTVEREVIDAQLNSFAVLQCPGTGENIPVTWKALNKEIMPEVIAQQTQDRITVDVFNRIVIKRAKAGDSNIYSCWQRSRLLGTVHLQIDDQSERVSNTVTLVTLLTALFIAFLTVRVGIKAYKHRRVK